MAPVGVHFGDIAGVAAGGIFHKVILVIDRKRGLGAGARLVRQSIHLLGGQEFERFRRRGTQGGLRESRGREQRGGEKRSGYSGQHVLGPCLFFRHSVAAAGAKETWVGWDQVWVWRRRAR